VGLGLWCLMPLSLIFQLYRDSWDEKICKIIIYTLLPKYFFCHICTGKKDRYFVYSTGLIAYNRMISNLSTIVIDILEICAMSGCTYTTLCDKVCQCNIFSCNQFLLQFSMQIFLKLCTMLSHILKIFIWHCESHLSPLTYNLGLFIKFKTLHLLTFFSMSHLTY
jgi:hypothetical protein